MTEYEKIRLALDLSETDATLLSYSKMLAPLLGATQVVGMHVIPVVKMADWVKLDYHHILSPVAPAVEEIRKSLHKELTTQFEDMETIETIVDLKEGRPYAKLAKETKWGQTDVLLVGRKNQSSHSGITAKKIVRNLSGDVLLLPKGNRPIIRQILVPVDFTDDSFRALQLAMHLSSKLGLHEKVKAIHLIDVGTTEMYRDEEVVHHLEQTMPLRAKESYELFLLKNQLSSSDFDMIFEYARDLNVAESIYQYAHREKTDLVIVGARRHSLLDRIMIGSVTENLVDACSEIPLWVVR